MFPGVVEYLHYFIAAAAYLLGEDGHGKLSGKRDKYLRWSEYRSAAFPAIVDGQNQGGSWQTPMPVLSAAVYLIVLQMDKGHLPMYRRQRP